LPSGDAQGVFRITAALLVVTELFGLIIALVGLWLLRMTLQRGSDAKSFK